MSAPQRMNGAPCRLSCMYAPAIGVLRAQSCVHIELLKLFHDRTLSNKGNSYHPSKTLSKPATRTNAETLQHIQGSGLTRLSSVG